jgi:hypothetical protein
VQARAVRGAQRHRILELCRQRPARAVRRNRRRERDDRLRRRVGRGDRGSRRHAPRRRPLGADPAVGARSSRPRPWPAGSPWSGLMLVVVPMLVTKIAGPWIVVATWRIWRPIVGVIAPGCAVARRRGTLLGGLVGRKRSEAAVGLERMQDELRLVVDEAHREGRLEGAARDMIEGVMDLNEAKVAQIMTSRTDMISISIATPWEEAVRLASESTTRGCPSGIARPTTSSASSTPANCSRSSWTQCPRPPGGPAGHPRPATAPAAALVRSRVDERAELLREFQRTHTHMAVVTDEFGGVSGSSRSKTRSRRSWARSPTSTTRRFPTASAWSRPTCARPRPGADRRDQRKNGDLPAEADFETVGGFVFHQCGRIPEWPPHRIAAWPSEARCHRPPHRPCAERVR